MVRINDNGYMSNNHIVSNEILINYNRPLIIDSKSYHNRQEELKSTYVPILGVR